MYTYFRFGKVFLHSKMADGHWLSDLVNELRMVIDWLSDLVNESPF